MRKNINKRESKHWLVYANASRCNHYASLKEAGFISWKRERNNFAIGDIVYVFSSKEGKIIYKAEVVAEEMRADDKYWIERPPMQMTWRLKAVEEYIGDALDKATLKLYG